MTRFLPLLKTRILERYQSLGKLGRRAIEIFNKPNLRPLQQRAAQETTKAIIFDCRKHGLANRLRALVGYQALSRILGVPFYLCWVGDHGCSAQFGDLFENPAFELLVPKQVDQLLSKEDALVFTELPWFHEIWSRHAATLVSWPIFSLEAHRCMHLLQPNHFISQAVDQFTREHQLERRLGVHIRHTDNLATYQKWAGKSTYFDASKISKIEGFITELDGRGSAGRFFLATDDPAVEHLFLSRYGNQLVVYDKEYLRPAKGNLRTTPIEIALIDMLLLGRCQSIAGTYYSSFGQFSAVWAGVAFHVMSDTTLSKCSFTERLQMPDG